MKEQLEQRLIELRKEYESGQEILKDIELKIVELENKKSGLSETLLRISGAIDMLEEVLGESENSSGQEKMKSPEAAAESIEVPNIIRQPLEKAKKILEDTGLIAGEIVEQKGILPIGIMAGDIIKQDPRPGIKLPAGSAVKLVVAAKGKYMPPSERRSFCE